MNEKEKQFNPTKKFRSFKGIYVEQTKQYFLCDFYEIGNQDGSILFLVEAELDKEKNNIEFMQENNSSGWNVCSTNCTPELERLLAQHIASILK